ncbi:alpha/beta hydrolase [Candidatus Saccharibacteria bacterium]|nr:alpha/beta hydrolase [Candidatus Saccharibacteria bacterium]
MKKTIILIHGLRGTHHGLLAIAQALSGKYKVLTPDLPGSGVRAELADKTMDGYVEWLHSYVKDLKLKQKPYIVGHSMGSIIVSHYLEKYPNDVQPKVVLMSPIFRSTISQKTSNVAFALANGFLHLMPKTLRHKFLASKAASFCISHYLTCDKTMQKQIDQLHYRYGGRFSSADSLMADMKISMQQQTVIPPKTQPHLIIGEKDKLTSLKLARATAKTHRIKIDTIPNSGHLINYERPAEVAELIVRAII